MKLTFKVISTAGAVMLLAPGVATSAAVVPQADASGPAATLQVRPVDQIDGRIVDDLADAAGPVSEESYGITILAGKTGEHAIADLSLASAEDTRERAAWAASSEGVQLSWGTDPAVNKYRVLKDGVLLGVVDNSEYFDSTAQPGTEVTYEVQSVVEEEGGEGRTWSLVVPVPASSKSDLPALRQEAEQVAASVAAIDKSSVTHKTFIPMQYLNAPPVGCSGYHGSTYSFGGDNRSWSQTSTAYRTRQIVNINWLTAASIATSNDVGPTKVYRTSNKQLLSTKTATNAGMSIRKMAGSTSAKVDLRFVLEAGNPFCTQIPNTIAAVYTMKVTRSGNWSITSGNHKQMPNHEIYMGRHQAGYPRYTTAYRRAYLSSVCLVQGSCKTATMGGYGGTY